MNDPVREVGFDSYPATPRSFNSACQRYGSSPTLQAYLAAEKIGPRVHPKAHVAVVAVLALVPAVDLRAEPWGDELVGTEKALVHAGELAPEGALAASFLGVRALGVGVGGGAMGGNRRAATDARHGGKSFRNTETVH